MQENKQLPIKIAVANPDKQKEILDFSKRVNISLPNLTPTMEEKVIDLSILLTCGELKENLNPGIRKTLTDYIKENMGPFQVEFGENGDVNQITLGNLRMGSLYCKPMTPTMEKEYVQRHKMCYGILPSIKEPDKMYITLGDKLIIGNQSSNLETDRDNAQIGNYYFNRNKILSNQEHAELIRFEIIDANVIEQTIDSYDKQGKKESNSSLNYVQATKNNLYRIVYQEKKEESQATIAEGTGITSVGKKAI